MEDSEDERDCREAFSRIRKRQLVVGGALIVIWIVTRLERADQVFGSSILGIPTAAYLVVAVAATIVVVGFSLYNWRCPSCRKYIGWTWNPRYCRKCGAHLQ